MDYYAIGQRIRKFRKAKGLSQEQLAESVDISVTHMSHIETGNTKLSLPVLVAIAKALEVQTDEILFEKSENDKTAALKQIDETLLSVNSAQAHILSDILQSAKQAFDKYL